MLKDVSFKALSGECIAILGSNGCGKSTLFNILSGITAKNSGEFICDNKDLFKNIKLREKLIAYVPQSPILIEELSAKDNLLMWYSKAEIAFCLSSGVLKKLDINSFLKTPVNKMSGGMKKRLSIACAISNKPKIILLDEPFSALDPICKKIIRDYIITFKNCGGIVILATHNLDELSLCDRCYEIKSGSLKEIKKSEILSDLAARL